MDRNIETKNTKLQVKSVIIILTHRCNLNCTYCYEHFKGEPCMNLECAKKIIENEMNTDDGCDREFEFFGGEPFLEFEKIVELHNFLSSREWSKKWVTTITTNGTLVHGKIKDWLYRNQKTVKFALSADGTPDMHNINRSNSYDKIEFDFFAKTNSVVKMTISAQTLSSLSKGVIYLHKLGFQVVRANLAFGIDWSNDKNLSVFASELRNLADFYIENPQIRPADIMDMPIEDIDPKSRSYASRHCGAGVELVAYEIDGRKYPCHTFAPISVSKDLARKARELNFEEEISIDCFDKKCQSCFIANVCPNCYGVNFSTTGNMYSKDDAFCRMIKVQFLANAYFKYQQYMSGRLNLTPEKEYRLLNNINLVQKLEVSIL